MKINQALKAKNKLVSKLNTLKHRIQDSNSYIKGNTPAYNAEELLKEYNNVSSELVGLKTKINIAIMPVFQHIIRMGELKSGVQMLKSISIASGTTTNYRDVVEERIATIPELKRDKLIEEAEKQIEDVQDFLDQFNATHDI